MCPEAVDVSVEDDDDSALIDLEDKVSELAQLLYGLPENMKVKFEFEDPATPLKVRAKNVVQVCNRFCTRLRIIGA